MSLRPKKRCVSVSILGVYTIRDWSLIAGRGGYTTGGGAREVLPLRKGGAEKVLGVVFTR